MPKNIRKTKNITKFLSLIAIVLVAVAGMRLLGNSNAQTSTVNVNMDWIDSSSSCYGTANGQTQTYYGAVKGDTINLHVVNVSSYTTQITVFNAATGGQASATLPAGGSYNHTYVANGEITVTNDAGPCSSGHGGSGAFYIEAAYGSMSCSLSNNQVWTIQIGYYGLAGNSMSLYRGGTYVEKFTNLKGANLLTSVQFAATTSSTAYKLYYGPTSSSRLLSQATCPAKKVAAASTSSSSSPTTSTSSKPTTSTNSKTTTTKPAASSSQEDSTSDIESNLNPTGALQLSTTAPVKKNNWLWLIIPVVAIPLAVLGYMKFYPKKTKTKK